MLWKEGNNRTLKGLNDRGGESMKVGLLRSMRERDSCENWDSCESNVGKTLI